MSHHPDLPEAIAELEEWTPPSGRGRMARLLGSSYGLSIAVHLGFLLVASLVVIYTFNEEEPPVTIVWRQEGTQPAAPPAPARLARSSPLDPPRVVRQVQPRYVQADHSDLLPTPEPLPVPTNPVLDRTPPIKTHDPMLLPEAFDTAGSEALGQRRQQAEAVYQNGGSLETEEAVEAALEWLARHQSPASQSPLGAPFGYWSPDGFHRQCHPHLDVAAADRGPPGGTTDRWRIRPLCTPGLPGRPRL